MFIIHHQYLWRSSFFFFCILFYRQRYKRKSYVSPSLNSRQVWTMEIHLRYPYLRYVKIVYSILIHNEDADTLHQQLKPNVSNVGTAWKITLNIWWQSRFTDWYCRVSVGWADVSAQLGDIARFRRTGYQQAIVLSV